MVVLAFALLLIGFGIAIRTRWFTGTETKPIQIVPVGTTIHTSKRVLGLVSRDEAWRKPTGLRFLERLKAELLELEDEFMSHHALREWLLGHKNEHPRDWLPPRLKYAEQSIADYQRKILRLKERIGKIFEGKVQDEIVQLEVDVGKLELQLGELTSTDENGSNRGQIGQVKRQLIETRADLKELQAYQQPESKEEPTEDERQAKAGIRRLDLELYHEYEQKFRRKIGPDAWRKQKKKEIAGDMTLTKEERKEQEQAVDQAYEQIRNEQEPATKIPLYKDDD